MSARQVARLGLALSLTLAVAGCGPGAVATDADAPRDAVADTTPQGPCARHSDCDDGRYCNGPERCAPGDLSADARGCAPAAMSPCRESERCDELAQLCRPTDVPDGGDAGSGECDRDRDGVRAIACGGTDCDDNDANRFPGNPERCDGSSAFGPLAAHDEDCDPCTVAGPLPDGDHDGDGFAAQSCTNTAAPGAPDPAGCSVRTVSVRGRTVSALDCADDDRSRNPDAPEVCNPGPDGRDVDDNCREDPPGATLTTVYLDRDNDGFGDPRSAVTTMSCPIPTGGGLVANDDDCDDMNPATFPGAEEICDRVINDCRARTAGGPIAREEEDRDNDGYAPMGASGACLGAGESSFATARPKTDCDDENPQRNPGRVDLCDGVDNDCSVLTNEEETNAGCASGVACRDGRCGWVDALVTRDNATCVLARNRELVCWGSDGGGGDSNWSGGLRGGGSATRTRVLFHFGAVEQFAPGDVFACAIQGGRVRCAGAAGLGRLGTGESTLTPSPTPRLVLDVVDATSIAVGSAHACAASRDGSLRCWGDNADGQLGDGTRTTALRPVRVAALSGVTQVALGKQHSCALDRDGALWCWGANAHGELGVGDTMSRAMPTRVALPMPADAVRTNEYFTCALLRDRTVSCWGANGFGQVGVPASTTPVLAPMSVAGVANVRDVALGVEHACALRHDGAVSCWGSNRDLQLGAMRATSTPEVIAGIPPADRIASGARHSCVSTPDGQILCWGDGSMGQIAPTLSRSGIVPTRVRPQMLPSELVGTSTNACVRRIDGDLYCAGQNSVGLLGRTDRMRSGVFVRNPGVRLARSMSLAPQHACVVVADGRVRCWGDGDSGRLGDGDVMSHETPSFVLGADRMPLTGARQVVTSRLASCALLDDGTVRCWGSVGALGDGRVGPSGVQSTAVTVVGLRDVEQLASGDRTVCARVASGAVFCWGFGATGECGDNSTSNTLRGAPVQVLREPQVGERVPPPLDGVRAIYGGSSLGRGSRFCASRTGSSFFCWGLNEAGALGLAETVTESPLAVSRYGLSAAQVALGRTTNFAITGAGLGVASWGLLPSGTAFSVSLQRGRSFNEVRTGITEPSTLEPSAIATIAPVELVASLDVGGMASNSDGVIFAWGSSNAYGQLAIGARTDAPTPTQVQFDTGP